MKMIHVRHGDGWLRFNPKFVEAIWDDLADMKVHLKVGDTSFTLKNEDGTLTDRLESDIEEALKGSQS